MTWKQSLVRKNKLKKYFHSPQTTWINIEYCLCEESYNNRKETLGFHNIFKDRTYSAKVVKRGKKYSQVSMRSNTVKSSQEQSHLCPVKSIPKSIAVLYSERQKQQGEEQRPSLKSFRTWKTQTFLTCRWNSSHYKR